jgi:DinB superfamily
MSEKIETLKAVANAAFGRFDMTMKDLRETEIDWRPVEEANSIRWILSHLSQQWNVGFQRTFRGDNGYKPAGWPDDYVGSKSITYTQLLADLSKGKAAVLEGFGKLTAADLTKEVQSPSGMVKRLDRLLRQLSEVTHHEGQIAYIRGAIGRRRQKDTHFLA